MTGISTHVLNTAQGKPAAGITVHLWRDGVKIASAVTDLNGRCAALLPPGTPLVRGPYILVFEVAPHIRGGFYPEISIAFTVSDIKAHYHVPLLVSPFGYTTYRGS